MPGYKSIMKLTDVTGFARNRFCACFWGNQRAMEEILDTEPNELLTSGEVKHSSNNVEFQLARMFSDLMVSLFDCQILCKAPKEFVHCLLILSIITIEKQEPGTPIGHEKFRSQASSIGSSRKLLFGKGGLDTAIWDLRTGSVLRQNRHLREEVSPSCGHSPASRFFVTS